MLEALVKVFFQHVLDRLGQRALARVEVRIEIDADALPQVLDDERRVPIRTLPTSIQGDLPFGPLAGLFAVMNSKGKSAMRSQVASLSGKGAAVANGTPQPVPRAKSRIVCVLMSDMVRVTPLIKGGRLAGVSLRHVSFKPPGADPVGGIPPMHATTPRRRPATRCRACMQA